MWKILAAAAFFSNVLQSLCLHCPRVPSAQLYSLVTCSSCLPTVPACVAIVPGVPPQAYHWLALAVWLVAVKRNASSPGYVWPQG